jgi:hypothetical protein
VGDDHGGVADEEPALPFEPPVIRDGPDRILLRFDSGERLLLGRLLADLRGRLDDPEGVAGEEALARLFPPAFPDDPEAEASYASLVREDLLDGRRARIRAVEATFDEVAIDDEQAVAWMGVLNDLRLVMGTSLGVAADDQDAGLPEPGDPDAFRRAVYGWLGWLVGWFVEALEATLPDVPDEDDADA